MNPTAGWYPVKLEHKDDGEIIVHWQDFAGVPFLEPFFEDTMSRARKGRGEYRQTPFLALRSCPLPPPIEPTAFIFHTSRSGSTLLTQLLSCLDGSVALSEPPIVDEILHLPMPPKEKSVLIKMLVLSLAQTRSQGDRYFFIKYDSWHTSWFPLIKEAFPDTPCFFVYRHPTEILWSHHLQRGSQMVPGLRNLDSLNLNLANLKPADLDGYAARVLESVFSQALPFVRTGELIPLDHTQLVQDPLGVITRFVADISPAEQERIRQRSRFHSKQKGNAYTPEIQRHIPEAVRLRLEELATPILLPAYRTLRNGSSEA
jgi:hypothetical protein